MSSHNASFQLFRAPLTIPDPGDTGSITVDRLPELVHLDSAGAETRTLAAPTRAGSIVSFCMRTDGGDITLTVTGGYDENGSTTFVFSDPGQFAVFQAYEIADGTFAWRKLVDYNIANLSGLTASAADLNTLDQQVLSTDAGTGFSGGTGTIIINRLYGSNGGFKKAEIFIDLTGLGSSTTDLDIIGTGTNPAYFARILTTELGTPIQAVRMECLEAPAGGVTDIDLYSASEATGKFDDAVTGLTETAIITAGGAWSNGTMKGATTVPAANEYLYLTGGAGGTAGTYTAGKFLITIVGDVD